MSGAETILYSFRRCPYAMRARMALKYAQIEYQHREILLKNKPESMLMYSPKATVPVLCIDELVLDESLDIMLWALAQSDKDNWLYENDFLLIQKCDEQFKVQLDHYKYADRYEDSAEHYRQESLWFLQLLEKQLSRTSFLSSNSITLADVAIFPFIRQFAFVDKTWFDASAFKNLQSWLSNWLKSKLFLSIMHKHPVWVDEKL